MLSILVGFFETSTLDVVDPILKSHPLVVATYATTVDEWNYLLKKQHYDLFLFQISANESNVQNIVNALKENPEHKFKPVYIFCKKIEILVSSYINWHCCECFLLPLSEESKLHFDELLHYHERLYYQILSPQKKHFQVESTKGIHVVPLTQILFVESTMKKSILHLRGEDLHLPYPLYRIRSLLPAENFVQTHRSFIVNVSNISFIDKSNEPWGIFFFDSHKEAYVSRSHQKELLPYFPSLQGTI